MGFHKKIINKKLTFDYLIENDLKSLYDADSIIITDDFSSFVRDLYVQNKTEKEILEILNYKQEKEETSNEMSESTENNQGS